LTHRRPRLSDGGCTRDDEDYTGLFVAKGDERFDTTRTTGRKPYRKKRNTREERGHEEKVDGTNASTDGENRVRFAGNSFRFRGA
jgi:hypothetical protein